MKEANMQSLFKMWLGCNMPKVTTVYELKIEKGKAMLFNRVADHQIVGLRQAKYAGLYYKLPDTLAMGAGMRFNIKKPFDTMVITKAEAYLVVMFYEPKKNKTCYFIDVDDFIKEKAESPRKSLTEERAREISSLIKII